MKNLNSKDLVIAIDYYDGEVEGFSLISGECRYFKREKLDLVGEENEYISVLISSEVFHEILRKVGAEGSGGKVYYYRGESEDANLLIDHAIAQATTVDMSRWVLSVGPTFAGSLESGLRGNP